MQGEERENEPETKDGLDEWVDELDRLIGIEEMTDEEIAAQHAAADKEKGSALLLAIVVAIVILAAAAVLLYLRIL
ncbi:MAG: hypothetical protein KIY12_01605 [Thermoplasmata archaeon]|uniref:Uncharacterized protein n=1 Tax=Candidatus Sysuiplasma superficiale TaxID=2823368 RepID=A0A8J7YM71_9ARCH|nr:hypothetical protein [Candidatus Sysuiplasma superficiale]MBX8643413.1 hypothetical protein [Candidatus Sysuiplasma superficiale]MCL4346815.1 hypothetical protein [Candidatus Thermoplasmatota archaeon]